MVAVQIRGRQMKGRRNLGKDWSPKHVGTGYNEQKRICKVMSLVFWLARYLA